MNDKRNFAPEVPELRGRLTRRAFLESTAMAAGSIAALSTQAAEVRLPGRRRSQLEIVDTNVTLSQWPFRRLPLDETSNLVSKLYEHQVIQAWAGSFDALLHKNIGAANARLAEECRKHGRGILVPFGSVNPRLPGWEEELGRCQHQHRMPGIRLYPNYHQYRLDAPAFAKLLDLASDAGLIVQVVISMEDERTQHPLVQVPAVDIKPMLALMEKRPPARIVLLNWFRGIKGELLKNLAASGQVLLDIATVEGVGGVGSVLDQIPARSLAFGSHAPFFYFEAAYLKLRESQLDDHQSWDICAGNARRFSSRT
jgi:predicted TIM-barrel fold metal-dependent hydrolase